ncbi:MAG: ferredoxin [Solirubrobacteraceae bacterium]
MSEHLRLDPIACDAHGMCAELLPEMIVLDDWGYPLIGSEPVPAALLALARRTADSCPTRALHLERRRSR